LRTNGQVIANLVTVDSEQRLGQTLLQLARTLGKKDPRSIRIELKISHEELSEMVGTTRPRISLFRQRFHNLGLIETNRDRFLIIKEKKLTNLPRSDRLERSRNPHDNFFRDRPVLDSNPLLSQRNVITHDPDMPTGYGQSAGFAFA
jgi:hypothetical protein